MTALRGGLAAVGVRGRVVGAVVGLDLGQPHRDRRARRRRRPATAPSSRGRDHNGRPREQRSRSTVTADAAGAAQARCSPATARSRSACSATRTGAVPPNADREASEPATVSTSRTAGREVRRDRGQVGVARGRPVRCRAPRRPARTPPRSRARRGTAPAGAPAIRRCRWRARSPAGRAPRAASVSKTSVSIIPVTAGSNRCSESMRVEDRLLVLLQIPVVGQRQALQRRQQPGVITDQPAGLAPGQLGDVRVLLLRHDRAAGRVGVGQAAHSRTPSSPR